MKRITGWDGLFGRWQDEADMYAALRRLREFYDQRRELVVEPFQLKLLEYVEKNGAKSLTPQVRDSLFGEGIHDEVRRDVNDLRRWFDDTTRAIVEHYRK